MNVIRSKSTFPPSAGVVPAVASAPSGGACPGITRRAAPISADRLIDQMWGNEVPENAAKSLQIQVSRLRKTLGSERLLTAGGGYRLVVRAGELDSERAVALVEAGAGLLERGEHSQAAESFADAIALYRGRPLEEFGDAEFAGAEAARLDELRAAAAEGAVEAELAQGRGARVVGDLQRLVAEHPFRERLRGQLMVALYQAGRQAEALAARRFVFVALPSRRTVLVVDPRTRATSAFGAPIAPARLARSEQGVWLLEPLTRRVALLGSDAVHSLPGGVPPLDALAGGRQMVWIAERDSEAVLRLDPVSGRIDLVDNRGPDSFFEGGARRAVAVGADSLWVSNPVTDYPATDRLGRVSRIDLRTGEVTARIRVPAPPSALAADADSVWVGLERGRQVWRIDPRDDVAAAAVAVDAPVADLAIGEGAVWVVGTDGSVSRIDPVTNMVTRRAELRRAAVVVAGHGSVWVATR